MKKLVWICLVLVFTGKSFALSVLHSSHTFHHTFIAIADTIPLKDTAQHKPLPPLPEEFILKPIIGLGTGVFTFYGDVNNKRLVLPQTSRIGYELSVSQNLNSFLNFRFYVLWGKLGANERSLTRNLNFESQIRIGGINLSYNFDQLLPKKRNIEPYVTAGVESFEFLSKTDLYDANGNKYYYWSDGSIRNIDEFAMNANQAIKIKRDYTYESDIREMNLDGFGKYAERSWAYTAGAGVTFILHKQVTFRIGTALHFTMTDYIDGVTAKSKGGRVGDSKNDKFLMTSFSLHYEFADKKNKIIDPNDTISFKDIDWLAFDLEDRDGDLVPDPKDSCQGTPKGVVVDAKGCPIDEDNDLVPNYLDDELNSAPNAIVDEHGVTMSDSLIARKYRMWSDTTGEFNDVVVLETAVAGGSNKVAKRVFTVLLAKYVKGVPADVMDKLLNIEDVKSILLKDSTTAYTAGSFNKIDDANTRAEQLHKAGFPDAKVVYKQNGSLYDVKSGNNNNSSTNNNNTNNNTNNNNNNNTNNNNTNNNNTNNNNTNNNTNNNNTNNNNTNNNNTNNNNTNNNNTNNNNTNNNSNNNNINVSGVIFRVQVGAFKKQISRVAFTEVPDIIEIKTESGLYKYMTGAYKDIEDAKTLKKNLSMIGYEDAFVVAYKDGKRIPLDKVGTIAPPPSNGNINPDNGNKAPDNNGTATNNKNVVFKVQVGVFSKEPPADIKEKLNKIKDLTKETTDNGQVHYYAGEFKDYKSAEARKKELKSVIGLDDAFIQAFHDGKSVSIQEALDVLRQE